MTGSMYASIAGLKTHMQKLSVIGNNVANVNTQGYKKQRTVFRDSVYRMYTSGTNGTTTIGSKTPSQLGYGSRIGSIDLDMSSSSYNPGNPTDCALVGDGFFIVGDKNIQQAIDGTNAESLKALTLTRVGDFSFGADGYLVDGNGSVVYGFMCIDEEYKNEEGNMVHRVSDQLVPIRKPTWERVLTGAQGEEGTDGYVAPVEEYVLRFPTTKPAAADGNAPADTDASTETFLRDVMKPLDAANRIDMDSGAATTDETRMTNLEFADLTSISIDAGTGAITGISREDGKTVTIGYLAMASVENPNGVTHIGNSYYQCGAGAGSMRINMFGGVQTELGITNINSFQVRDAAADGNQAGAGGGAGTTLPCPPGMQIGSGGGTSMMTGFLEAPNTDLAEEISELITTQRGYQANTRIVTVTDSMLEELVNMKR